MVQNIYYVTAHRKTMEEKWMGNRKRSGQSVTSTWMRSKASLAAVLMPQADMHSLAASSWPNGHPLPKHTELFIWTLDSNRYLHLCHHTVSIVYSDSAVLIQFLLIYRTLHFHVYCYIMCGPLRMETKQMHNP